MENVEKIITWMDWATILFSFCAMFFAGRNWYLEKKQRKEIKIIILKDNIEKVLPIKILRKNLTRSELFGVLAVFEKDSKFDIKFISTQKFFNSLEEIQKGNSDILKIIISPEDKFDWNEL